MEFSAMRQALLLSAVSLLGATSCLTVEVSPGASGVYACSGDAECPGGQLCVFDVCEATELPELEITAPEDEEAFTLMDGDGETTTRLIRVIGTGLELVDPASDPDAELGKGHVVLIVDGQEAEVFVSGDLTGGLTTEVEIDNTPGVHRIRAVARTSAGVNYPNQEADARRIFWLDDGRERIAFKNIWPGQEFPLEAVDVLIELAAINVQLVQPAAMAAEGEGHGHIYFDQMFPACIEEQTCDNSYNGIVPDVGDGPGPVGSVTLPNAAAGEYSLSAVLRERSHAPYNAGPIDQPEFVWDTIPIGRSADAPPPEDPQ
jgi:hypothetical protein